MTPAPSKGAAWPFPFVVGMMAGAGLILALAVGTAPPPPAAIEHTPVAHVPAIIELHDFREDRRSIKPLYWRCEPKPGLAPAWKVKPKVEPTK